MTGQDPNPSSIDVASCEDQGTAAAAVTKLGAPSRSKSEWELRTVHKELKSDLCGRVAQPSNSPISRSNLTTQTRPQAPLLSSHCDGRS